MKRMLKKQKGFTLMELLVVVAIMGVLMAVVGAAVTGIKSSSVDGQVQSDAKATQTATDNYNNKSINTGQFPDTTPDAASHINQDVADVGTGDDGFAVVLVRTDGLGETLFDKTIPFGTSSAVFQHRLVVFTSTTDTWDDSTGAVKTSTFVPDYLLKEPTSLILKGDESKDLGATNNVFEEYLWLNLVNAPGTDAESRTVEVYRMSAGDCSNSIHSSVIIGGRTQPAAADAPDPADISAAGIATLKALASGCTGNTSVVNGLVYEQVY